MAILSGWFKKNTSPIGPVNGQGPMYPGPWPNSRHTVLSYQAAASGDQHQFTFIDATGIGVNLHPWQRMGAVSSAAAAFTGHMMAAGGQSWQGDAAPAALAPVGWPPVLNPVGSARDPAVMV